MLSTHQRTIFLIVIVQICVTCTTTLAFQFSSNTNALQRRYKKSGVQSKTQHSSTHVEEEESSSTHPDSMTNMNRRKVFKSLGLLFTSSAIISSNSEDAEAAGTLGYIPDMVGGLKKPKNVGGLTKKIRKVGDIMVSLIDIEICIYICDV